MFEKLDEIKVLRDPIHGYVHIDLKVVWDCLNAKEFQRLKRIRQLGGSFQVYHTAEHSRFSHSLGVYEIVRIMVTDNYSISDSLNDLEKVTVMLAGLLHDIGHGPYSHTFENICKTKHEEMTTKIILEETEIHAALEKAYRGLSKLVASVIDSTHPNPILSQMITGQLDADRMDYLLRDAYFTGTKYGEFDIQRILRTLRIKENTLTIKHSGIHSVEDYIMARYHMYWQVYFHPVARSFELMLQNFFVRLKDVVALRPEMINYFEPFKAILLDEFLTVEEHYCLDESCFNYGISCFTTCEDAILRDLSISIMDRHLFGYEDYIDETQIESIKVKIGQAGLDPKYYLLSDEAKKRPYLPYKGDTKSMIYVDTKEGIKELSEVSVIADALVHGESIHDSKIYYPKELMTRDE